MVTVRELVVLSGSFVSRSKSVKHRAPPLRGRASHDRYAVFTVEAREISLCYKSLGAQRSSKPGPLA